MYTLKLINVQYAAAQYNNLVDYGTRAIDAGYFRHAIDLGSKSKCSNNTQNALD